MSGDRDEVIQDSIIHDLEKVLMLFNQFIQFQEQFLRSCKEWRNYRNKTLTIFDEFQRELIMAASSSVSAGENSTITSEIAPFETGTGSFPSIGACTSFFKNWSMPAVSLLGNVKDILYEPCVRLVGKFSDSITCEEIWQNKNLLKDVNNALREDQLHTQMIYPWFQKSQELEILFQRIFGCSLLSEFLNDIFNAIVKLSTECERGINSRNEQLLFSQNINTHVVERVLQHANDRSKRYLLEFCGNLAVRQAMLSVMDSIKNNPSTLEHVKLVVLVSSKSLNMRVEYEEVLSLLPTSIQDLFHTASQLTQGVFLAIPLSISAWSFISAAKDILEETSRYINLLDDIKRCLLNELNCLLKEYPEVCMGV